MTIRRRKVCMIAVRALSTCPRLLKNAAALAEVGFDVRVVSMVRPGPWSDYDASVASNGPWTWDGLRVTTQDRIRGRLIRDAAMAAITVGAWRIPAVASLAICPTARSIARFAARESADIYIGHAANSLPVVLRAAAARRSLAGFDAEDFHPGEYRDATMQRARLTLDRHFLPQCALLTAGSPGIAKVYEETCDVRMTPVLNVFPLAEAPASPRPGSRSAGEPLRAYWFSQTIGLDRGLQPFIEAMGMAQTRVELDIRGDVTPNVRRELAAVAERFGVAHRVRFLGLASPEKMVMLARDYDFGLSVGPSISTNRDVCLANKIFVYLLAGTPVLLSATNAQVDLAASLGDAAQVVDVRTPSRIAEAIDYWGEDNAAMKRARAHAWLLGRERFNWEAERQTYLAAVDRALGRVRN